MEETKLNSETPFSYPDSFSASEKLTPHEIQQICEPVLKTLRWLHRLSWQNRPESREFVCAIDKGYLELVSCLTALDAEEVTPPELSAPARVISVLSKTITEKTRHAQRLKHVLDNATAAFLEPPKRSTVGRSIPMWRQRGKLISEKKSELITVLCASAITPRYYLLHSKLMAAYQELRNHTEFMQKNFKEIRQAFPFLLSAFYDVEGVAHEQFPEIERLDSAQCLSNALLLFDKVERGWGKKVKPTPFIKLRQCAKQIGELPLAAPPGLSTDVCQHVEALAQRMGIACEMIENHVAQLPFFVSRLLWIPSEDLKDFTKFWDENQEILSSVLKTVQKTLIAIAKGDGKDPIPLLELADCSARVYLPKIRKVSSKIREQLLGASLSYADRECEYKRDPLDLMITHSQIINTIADDLQHQLTHLCPLVVAMEWSVDEVLRFAKPVEKALEPFCRVKHPQGHREDAHVIRMIEDRYAELKLYLEELKGGNRSPLTVSGPLRLAMILYDHLVNMKKTMKKTDRLRTLQNALRHVVLVTVSKVKVKH